jgi:rod shape-determining protein MreC
MEYGPPPLFNQGVSARARLAFFSLVAAVLIIIDAQVNALDAIRNGVEILLYPVQRVLLWPRDLAGAAGEYFVTNRSLARENAQLREQALAQAQRVQEAGELLTENEQLRKLAGLRERLAVPAQVVRALYESRDPFSHRIVIDRGSRDGMRAGGPVIDEAGVVGQVTRVFPVSAEVTLITDKEQSLPVQIARNGLHAVAFGGTEANSLELRFLPANVEIQEGDAVVTSGLDGVYPPGLAVGTVARIDRDVKDQFARVVLKPVAGTSMSRMLLVITAEPPPLPPPDASRRDAPPANARVAPKGGRR